MALRKQEKRKVIIGNSQGKVNASWGQYKIRNNIKKGLKYRLT
jgi:hypothetical protein